MMLVGSLEMRLREFGSNAMAFFKLHVRDVQGLDGIDRLLPVVRILIMDQSFLIRENASTFLTPASCMRLRWVSSMLPSRSPRTKTQRSSE